MKVLLAWLFMVTPVFAADDLLLHLTFDDVSGGRVADTSSQGNHGKIVGNVQQRRGKFGAAGYFDGKGGYLDCNTNDLLALSDTGTLSIWCRPDTVQGGLVNWSTGSGWHDERLVLAINTYGENQSLLFVCADGESANQQASFADVTEIGQWTHLAVTFDRDHIALYRNGLVENIVPRRVISATGGVPLWIGKCLGLGNSYFHGLIDEVRVYRRAISDKQVFQLYKQDVKGRERDTTYFTRPRISALTMPDQGKVKITIDARAMQPLPAAAEAILTVIGKEQKLVLDHKGQAEVVVDCHHLPAGDLSASARLTSTGNVSNITFHWPGQPEAYQHMKVLNNLVWELLNERDVSEGDYLITLPCDRWVYILSKATIAPGGQRKISIGQDQLINHTGEGSQSYEAMRFLRAGDHTVQIDGAGEVRNHEFIVRAIPMLQHANYNSNPIIKAHGPFDWTFVEKYILPDANTMVSRSGGVDPAHLKKWIASGRHWINMVTVPRPLTLDDAGVQKAFEHWTNVDAMQRSDMHGIIIDEFGGGDAPVYDIYRKAFERIYADKRFRGRPIMPYGGTFYGNNRSRGMARAAIKGGGYVAWEVYLQEQASEDAARRLIHRRATARMERWIQAMPTGAQGMLMVWGIMSQPNESLNIHPGVNFKVFMDMQMQAAANEPAFFGLAGFQWYYSPYCDEESMRWMAKLYRHYCIEGNTDRLSKDPYILPHIANPDFADGVTGWTVHAADNDSVTTTKQKHLSWLQGRYPPTPVGNTCLVMRRSSAKPNSFSQTIKDLQPGRLYTMKMITADQQHLVDEVSKEQQHAVRITIDGADVQTQPLDNFDYIFGSCYSHIVGKFNAKHPYYMNYHWRVFRATGKTAELTVSDWVDDKNPGGPIGQKLMYNFIEVQPYLPR